MPVPVSGRAGVGESRHGVEVQKLRRKRLAQVSALPPAY
jgi:hypothetical protein